MAEVSKTERYHITLTKEEAEVICFILRRVGGCPSGERGVADRISRGLHACGVEPPHSLAAFAKGSIYFTD